MSYVLIADDEAHILRVMRLTLEKEGYVVNTAPNGVDALKMIKQQHPNVLITDIEMPKMNGEQLCHELSTPDFKRDFPIIVMTSRTEEEHREWSSQLENIYFLEKPVSINKIKSILNQCLNDERS